MIFYTKLTKQKKFKTSAFTLIELIVVIIIIGIIVATLSFDYSPDKLQLAADQVIRDIRFTQSLALKDDKYQPFSIDSSNKETNRSKFWFKQWWQIRFNCTDNYCFYEIFSDLPYSSNRQNFDRTAHLPSDKTYWDKSIAKDPLTGKYLIGICNDGTDYPDCNQTNIDLNITKAYGIQDIEYKNFSTTYEQLFDNYGNIFTREGDNFSVGVPNDINPLDPNKRKLLTKIAKIKLCKTKPCVNENDKCIQINITPNGEIFKSDCDF